MTDHDSWNFVLKIRLILDSEFLRCYEFLFTISVLIGGKETDPAATLESADEDRGLKICDAFGDPLYVIGLRDFVHMDSSDTISTEELLKYKEEIAKTGGFDVDPPPKCIFAWRNPTSLRLGFRRGQRGFGDGQIVLKSCN